MTTHGRVLLTLLLGAGLSGCTAPDSAAGDPVSSGDDGAPLVDWSANNGTALSHNGTRELAANFHFDTHIVVNPNPTSCDPAKPWVCDVYYSGTSNFTGALIGTAQVYGHGHYDQANERVWAHEVYSFSGFVPGCGSGAATIDVLGYGKLEPNPAGVLHIHAVAALVPGSTTTGLAGLVDLQGTADFRLNGQFGAGDVTATMWCK